MPFAKLDLLTLSHDLFFNIIVIFPNSDQCAGRTWAESAQLTWAWPKSFDYIAHAGRASPTGRFKEHWAWLELCQLTILLSHSPARRAGAVLRSENIILYLFIPTWDKLKFGSQRWRHINSLQSFRIKMIKIFIFYNFKDTLVINHFEFLQII